MSSFERAPSAASTSTSYGASSASYSSPGTYRSPFTDLKDEEYTEPRACSAHDTPLPNNSCDNSSGSEHTLRTCRICLETSDQLVDPELGRLISPCRCRGSSKYVHVECLQRWRLTSVNSKSYYQCNTCNYRYKLRRLRWGKWVSSTVLQITLTTTILSTTIYLLGFIADPIISAYLNSSSLPNPPPQVRRVLHERQTRLQQQQQQQQAQSQPLPTGFLEHMLKGLTSLGLLGFLKVIFLIGPSSWWNLRNSGIFSSSSRPTAGSTGRDRLGQLGWIVVALGVLNFFLWVWNKVRDFTRNVLEKAAEEIVDIAEEEEDEEKERERKSR